MSEGAAQLADYFRRWSDIEDRKAELSDESRDMFGDMKAVGFDTKAARAVFRDMRKELNSDKAEAQEQQAIYDLYFAALSEGLAKPFARPASAHEKTLNNLPPRDPETGEVDQGGDKPGFDICDGMQAATPISLSPPGPQRAAEQPGAILLPAPGTVSDADVPVFLRKSHEPSPPKLNPDCQKAANGEPCTLSHSMASCSKCANAAMLARRGVAA